MRVALKSRILPSERPFSKKNATVSINLITSGRNKADGSLIAGYMIYAKEVCSPTPCPSSRQGVWLQYTSGARGVVGAGCEDGTVLTHPLGVTPAAQHFFNWTIPDLNFNQYQFFAIAYVTDSAGANPVLVEARLRILDRTPIEFPTCPFTTDKPNAARSSIDGGYVELREDSPTQRPPCVNPNTPADFRFPEYCGGSMFIAYSDIATSASDITGICQLFGRLFMATRGNMVEVIPIDSADRGPVYSYGLNFAFAGLFGGDPEVLYARMLPVYSCRVNYGCITRKWLKTIAAIDEDAELSLTERICVERTILPFDQCGCDPGCVELGDCCPDYADTCFISRIITPEPNVYA